MTEACVAMCLHPACLPDYVPTCLPACLHDCLPARTPARYHSLRPVALAWPGVRGAGACTPPITLDPTRCARGSGEAPGCQFAVRCTLTQKLPHTWYQLLCHSLCTAAGRLFHARQAARQLHRQHLYVVLTTPLLWRGGRGGGQARGGRSCRVVVDWAWATQMGWGGAGGGGWVGGWVHAGWWWA